MSKLVDFNEIFVEFPSIIVIFYSFMLVSIATYVLLTYFSIVFNLFVTNFRNKNILFIIAHPDDECMFFGPTLTSLSVNNKISIVCLTSGNFYNIGDVRKKELVKSAEIFGLTSNNVFIVDKKELPDDPNIEWNDDFVCEEIVEICNKVLPDTIITFDSYGVSKHQNHVKLYDTVRKILSESTVKSKLQVLPVSYSLDSISIWRKYISVFDILFSLLNNNYIFVSSLNQVQTTMKAMFAHRSQLMWFRRLYIIFSRYMFINTLTEIKPDL